MYIKCNDDYSEKRMRTSVHCSMKEKKRLDRSDEWEEKEKVDKKRSIARTTIRIGDQAE
jgi:hypothetical protein